MSLGQNFVLTNTPRVAGYTNFMQLPGLNTCQLQQSILYADGLGRPIQTVQVQASAQGFDMVAPQAYDTYGREIYKYLPYTPQTGTGGSYRPNAVSSDQQAFYTTPPSASNVSAISSAYAQTVFDNSPLNRPVEQGAPGTAWQVTGTGDHTVKMIYTLNNATSFATDSINGRQAALYYTTISSTGAQTLVANGYYAANELTVTIMEDENWQSGRAGTVEEYKDNDGHVVLKRQYNVTGTTVQMLSTYYVYDDLGHLAFVLPPSSGADGAGTIGSAALNGYCYQYQYDLRGRPMAKKLPGKGWEYTVYNNMDQPAATQDANQAAAFEWIFTKYDGMGRVIMTGIWNNGGTSISQASLQGVLNGITTNLYETPVTTGNGYTNVAWPTSSVTQMLSINYYDSYSTMPGMPAAYTAPATAALNTRGELTGTQTNVLTTANMLWTAHYYDNWGRVMEGYAQHYLGGTISANNYDAVSTTYNFTNQPTTVTRKHWTSTSTGYPLVTVYNKYIYDQVGRKLKTWEQLTNTNQTPDVMRLVSQANYNEIGQLWQKQLHSSDSVTFLQNVGYTYNERGWLLGSSAPLFAMRLQYNANPLALSISPRYNGDIASQSYGTPNSPNSPNINYVIYNYDKINRLLTGNSSAGNNENTITYDPEGNISTLNRYQNSILIDQLAYLYTTSTNQLNTITDNSGNNNGLPAGTTTYNNYDPNGNMLSATNSTNTQGNKSFTYNLLNLPLTSTFATGSAAFTYDATGTKLQKASTVSGVTTYTDYIGGIQYSGTSSESIAFIETEEGKAVPNGATSYDYNYFLGDNLGNTRVSFGTATGTAVLYQQDDYYPFGMEISRTAYTPKNEYLYNKKELQEEFGEYDYGARFYDPVIARWNTIDPLAEASRRWSPYNYVEDNPITFTDPDGMSVTWNLDGSVTYDNVGNPDALNYALGIQVYANKAVGNALAFIGIGGGKGGNSGSSAGGRPHDGDKDKSGKIYSEYLHGWVPANVYWDLHYHLLNLKMNFYEKDENRQQTEQNMELAAGVGKGAFNSVTFYFGGELFAGWLFRGIIAIDWAAASDAPLVGDLANSIDAEFGNGTVQGVEQPYSGPYGEGDVDIATEKANIEVKSGSKMKLTQQLKNLAHATAERKSYFFYMPEATSTQIREAAKSGIIVLKNQSQLFNALKQL